MLGGLAGLLPAVWELVVVGVQLVGFAVEIVLARAEQHVVVQAAQELALLFDLFVAVF